jgi:hypothetical protein
MLGVSRVAEQSWQRSAEPWGTRGDLPRTHLDREPPARGSARPPGGQPRPEPAAGAVRLTGRGAVLLMIAAFTLGLLAQAVTGWAVLAGVGFAAGAVAAARYTKPADLLTVAVTPPVVFLCVLLVFKGVSASGNVLFSIAGGSALSLASIAPWLLTGTAACLVIAFFRGLPRCVADLRQDLTSPAARTGPPATADPGQRPGR